MCSKNAEQLGSTVKYDLYNSDNSSAFLNRQGPLGFPFGKFRRHFQFEKGGQITTMISNKTRIVLYHTVIMQMYSIIHI